MRAVRVMRLGMRTYRISCMDVTDSICRALQYSVHIFQISGKSRGSTTNRIGRALRVAMPPAERFNTFESHPCQAPRSRQLLLPTRITARAHENRRSCPRESRLVPTRHRARRQPRHHSTRQNRNEFFYSRDLAQADHSLRALRTN